MNAALRKRKKTVDRLISQLLILYLRMHYEQCKYRRFNCQRVIFWNCPVWTQN